MLLDLLQCRGQPPARRTTHPRTSAVPRSRNLPERQALCLGSEGQEERPPREAGLLHKSQPQLTTRRALGDPGRYLRRRSTWYICFLPAGSPPLLGTARPQTHSLGGRAEFSIRAAAFIQSDTILVCTAPPSPSAPRAPSRACALTRGQGHFRA